jgi:hypothetical protein
MTDLFAYMDCITIKRVKPGSYDVLDAKTKQKIAEVHKTGTHLDNYPWDWSFEQGVTLRSKDYRTGAADSLRSAKETISFRYFRRNDQS